MLLAAEAVVNPSLLQYHKQFEALRSRSSGKCGNFTGTDSGHHGVRCGEMIAPTRVSAGGAECIEADTKQSEREEAAKNVDNE